MLKQTNHKKLFLLRTMIALLIVVFAFAPIISAAPLTKTLREGDSGAEVKLVQQKLIEKKYLSGTADGKFGPKTLEAVKKFQKDNNLSADGVVGKATEAKLFAAASGGTNTGSIRQGMTGDAVKEVQTALKNKGYYTSNVDGKFGAQTLAAVKKFQKDNGLTQDGIVGPATKAKLLGSGGTSVKPPSGTIRYGMSGEDVKSVQTALKNKGYFSANVDGKFGVLTQDAVKKFQKDNSLTQDGVVGPATKAKLFGSSGSASTSSGVLKQGSTGEEVSRMQTRLGGLGYLSGRADGNFGPSTKRAVVAFQSRAGLKADGVAGAKTLSKLYSSDAPNADKSYDNTANPLGDRAVAYAKTFLGIPYAWGKADPAVGFDCSGLVWYVYKHFGVSVPRGTNGMDNTGVGISSLSAARPGDIICYEQNPVKHVGIYVGNGQLIHAPQTGEVIKIANVNTKRFFTIRRVTG